MAHPTRFCSFCGYSENERYFLIAGPAAVFICEECVSQCQDMIAEKRIKEACQQSEDRPEHMSDVKAALE